MKISSTTRIYVAGCGGMLGNALFAHFSRRAVVMASDLVADEPWLHPADVRDHAAMRDALRRFAPDLILNLAALTDLEHCEADSQLAWDTNALGAENLARIAGELGARYVYISTAGVFDGRQGSYTEDDAPNPSCVYGRSKLAGEERAQASASKVFVVRAGWMMGGGPRKDKKFVNKIYRQLAEGRTELLAVDDKAGSPTYTHDFAAGLERLIDADRPGLYHMAAEGRCTRHDVAVELVALLGLEHRVKVHAVGSERFATEYFAQRPASEALVNARIRALGLPPMRDWRAALADYAQVFREDWRARGRS